MNTFVCDFLQDENGHFHFMKIHDFHTDGKPIFNHDWKMSAKYINHQKEKEEKMIQGQVCEAKIICEDQVSSNLLEKACLGADSWPGKRIYGKIAIKHMTKYLKEVEIGKDSLSLFENPNNKFDVTPFYPLIAFPERNDPKFKQFEKRMIDADKRMHGL